MKQSERVAEQARVDQVEKEIKRQLATTTKAVEDAHKETRAVEQNYSENASINRYEVDDIAESRSMIEQQRQLVSRAAESENILKHQLKTLKNLQGSPYFGRIDIQDLDSNHREQLYIGTSSLMNEDKTDFLVYDWRAPISGVYYNGTLGRVNYETPGGMQTTELKKKRQFTIEKGQITNMFDTNETVGDEVLQAALGQENDQYMHNIVATIQQEQNDIIRDTKSDLLLVQGVAGSGKTSAILQRIAYLLYHSRANLNADQIVLFSPNNLFSHYISQVLPSLGERNMRQVTLEGFVRRRFEGLQVESLFDRYEKRLQDGNGLQAVANFIESETMMTAIANYVRDMTVDDVQFADLEFNNEVFFTADYIQTLYRSLPDSFSPADRLVQLKNKLIRELQRRVKVEAKKDWVAKELDALDLQQLHNLYGKKEPGDFKNEDAQYAYLARRLAKRRLRVVADAIYNNYFLDFYNQYDQFLHRLLLPTTISHREWATMILSFQEDIEYHRLALMHAAPLMYLRDLMLGNGQNRAFQYVFIDEMQDYSAAMLIYLRHAFPKAKFTVLGDSEQALFNPLQLPEDLLQQLSTTLNARRPNLIALRRSYRSTAEITDFAKNLLPDGDRIISFTRHGDKPRLLVRYSVVDYQQTLIDETVKLAAKHETVAVLTKNQAQATAIYQLLHREKLANLHLLSQDDSELPKGILILPIYLAKGLEFDGVVAADISAANLARTEEVGMIYTMATRAMHDLVLLSNGPVSKAVNEAASKLLTIEHQLPPRK